jgi:hypothetical protein
MEVVQLIIERSPDTHSVLTNIIIPRALRSSELLRKFSELGFEPATLLIWDSYNLTGAENGC